MKLGTIVGEGSRQIAVVEVAPGTLARLVDLGPWHSVRSLVEGGATALGELRTRLAEGDFATMPAAGVVHAPPIPDPSKMLFVALNNSAMDRMLVHRPDFPVYFPKLPSSLAGSGATLDLHTQYGLTHAEPELGVVIGTTARQVSIADAMDHVFGYTVVNDVTSAGMRMEDIYFGRYPMPDGKGGFTAVEEHLLYPGRYKNADGFAPMGPYITTRDEVVDPGNLAVKAWIDDEPIADDNTRNLHYSIAEVIHWVSMHSTLLPGDILSMGTALHPDTGARPLARGDINRFGDVMRVEIEQLGTVVTPIRRIRDADPRDYFAANKRFMKTLDAVPAV